MNELLVAEKLKRIEICRHELSALLDLEFEEFRAHPPHFRLAERDIQLIVDSAVDVNNHLALTAGRSPSASYFDSFVELGRSKVLPVRLATRLARTTGLRNRIVHEYEGVDLRILFRALPSLLKDYGQYIRHVRAWAGE